MSQVTIYHNPRCSKSRQTLQLLQEQGIEPKVVEYLQHPLSVSQLKTILKQLGIAPRALLRTTEAEYKENNLKETNLTDDALLKAMAAMPKLIQRPIVVMGNAAVLGRPPENVLALLSGDRVS